MTAGNAILIVAIVTGLSLIGALFFVMFKIRQISREFFGTSSLIEGLKRQEALEDDTPKSVSGMTRVELPRIEKDFPEFHWPEWKQRCENQLKGYLEALEHRDLSYLGKVSVSLKDQVRLKIEEMEEKEIREEFDAIHVHQTEISRYDKDPGKCRIRIQSAVEYLHTLKTPDKKKNVEREKEQHRFNLELVYIQDITKIRDGRDRYRCQLSPLWRTGCRSWRSRLSILRRRCGAGECESVGATPNRGSVNRNDMEKTLEF